MKEVWIVTEWPPYEGEDIIGVFGTEEKAKAFVEEREAYWATKKHPEYVELYHLEVQ